MVAGEVDAGIVEVDAADFEPLTPERGKAQEDGDGGRAEERLGSEAGVFLYGEVVNGEARQREDFKVHGAEVDGVSEAAREAVGDGAVVAADVDERQQKPGDDDEQDEGQGDPVTAACWVGRQPLGHPREARSCYFTR